jgi:hypothetical protein
MDSPIHPNDVAVILRPSFEEGQDWNGNFEIIISGFGPMTMPEENVREMMSMAMLIATVIPMMEKDVKLTERIMEECAKYYGDPESVVINDDDPINDDYVLTVNSKTVGGMQ